MAAALRFGVQRVKILILNDKCSIQVPNFDGSLPIGNLGARQEFGAGGYGVGKLGCGGWFEPEIAQKFSLVPKELTN